MSSGAVSGSSESGNVVLVPKKVLLAAELGRERQSAGFRMVALGSEIGLAGSKTSAKKGPSVNNRHTNYYTHPGGSLVRPHRMDVRHRLRQTAAQATRKAVGTQSWHEPSWARRCW